MVNDTGRNRRQRSGSIAEAYRIAHEVMSAALSVPIFAGLGYWLDLKFGCRPLLIICGAGYGFVVAGFSLRRLLQRLDKQTHSKQVSRSGRSGDDNKSEIGDGEAGGK